MSKGQLTRQELGWLLTQQAQGAAERLRKGVQIIRTSMPPPLVPQHLSAPVIEGHEHVQLDATLDALDDAMRLLTSLHQTRPGARVRRGRIDVAALVVELYPEARVALEPGSGTEVFGEEDEIQRMLQVHLGTRLDQKISIRREGDEVCVVASLGSEGSPTAETERAWISRMAIRYGGRYELEGDRAILALPADGVSERNEREALRRELDEAKAQGAAYARELARVYEPRDERSSSFPVASDERRSRAGELSAVVGAIASELRAALGDASALLRQSKPQPEDDETLRRRMAATVEFSESLASFATVHGDELPVTLDVANLVATAAEAFSFRASRAEIEFKADGLDVESLTRAPQRSLDWCVRRILADAIQATPKGGAVRLTLEPGRVDRGPRLHIDDGGPPLAMAQRGEFVALRIEPGALGRHSAFGYHLASQLILAAGLGFELGDAPPPASGLRVTIMFPKGPQ